MSGHFIQKCRRCDATIGQCRCIGPKHVEYGLCQTCATLPPSGGKAETGKLTHEHEDLSPPRQRACCPKCGGQLKTEFCMGQTQEEWEIFAKELRKEHCHETGDPTHKWRWDVPMSERWPRCRTLQGGEHLHRICPECQYVLTEPCKDAACGERT